MGLEKEIKSQVLPLQKIIVVDPEYSSPNEDKEIYIGEDYVFDSRIKDVDRDRISVKITGSAVNSKTFNSYQAKLKPKSRGNVKFITMVDGNNVKGLTHEVKSERFLTLN